MELGTMRTNMVRRLQRAGHHCVVYGTKQEAVWELATDGAAGSVSLEEFSGKLKKPGAVSMMVPAAAVDPTETVPAPVLSAALYERFSSRGDDDFAGKLLSALRYQFGGYKEKAPPKKETA